MEISIRMARPEDAVYIAELSQETFYSTFASHNSPADMEKFLTEQFSIEELIKEVIAPGNIFLLAYDGDQPVGYARLRENNHHPLLGADSSIEIARLYAKADQIGKGVGKSLMHAAIQIGEQKKASVIWLGVWEKNLRAIRFYEKWGFEKFGEHDFLLGNDIQIDWLMKRPLGVSQESY